MRRRFRQVDVFGSAALAGNPVAVVLDADGLTDTAMQRLAAWTNLSETTFVLPPTTPDADYRVRIFTPSAELPFAGHPTLGTCHAWLASGGVPRHDEIIVQECGAGPVALRRDGRHLAFAAPPLLRSGPVDEPTVAQVAAELRIARSAIVAAEWADNGPGWVAVLLADADAVLALRPTVVTVDIGVVGPHPSGAPAAFEVRAFSPDAGGVREDPVTGSLNAAVGQWLLASGRASAPYVARQGTALGRDGRVHVDTDAAGTVLVGGSTVDVVTGTIEL